MSAPIDTRLLSHTLPPPTPCSLEGNYIGVEGTSALAAVLKETNITNLESEPLPQVFAFVSAPSDTLLTSPPAPRFDDAALVSITSRATPPTIWSK